MAFLSVDEHRELFANAGYSDIEIIEEHDKGWICGIGRKPSMPQGSIPGDSQEGE